jgi:hypothetical protein
LFGVSCQPQSPKSITKTSGFLVASGFLSNPKK